MKLASETPLNWLQQGLDGVLEKWFSYLCSCVWPFDVPISCHWSLFIPSENIRKTEVFFWCFQGVSTEISGNITWNIYNGAFCKNNYMIKAIILVKSAIIDICRVHYSCSWTWIIYSPCVWRAIICKFRHLHLFLLLVTFIHKTDRILFWKKYTYLV